MDRIKELRVSFWAWFVLSGLALLAFVASTAGFFSNTKIPSPWRYAWLVLAAFLLILAYHGWQAERMTASMDRRIERKLSDAEYGRTLDERVLNLFKTHLADAELVKHMERRVQELVTQRLSDPVVVAQTSHLDNVRQAFESSAHAYGLFYEFQRVYCYVDENGHITLTRNAKLSAYTHVSEFYVYLLLPERSAQGELLPPRIEKVGDGPKLDSGNPVWFMSRQLSTIQMDPPLDAGHSVEFRLHEGSTTQVFRTPQKPKTSKTLDDYVYWDITYPTRQLDIVVTLPPGMVITGVTVDALYSIGGPSPTRHALEYERIRGSVVDENQANHVLKLTIDRPLVSVKYKLGWYPDPSYTLPNP